MAGIISSITGRVPKAILFVRKYDASFFQLLLQGAAEKELGDLVQQSTAAFDKVETDMIHATVAGSAGAVIARDAVSAVLQAGAEIAGLCSVKVQYNPSSLYFDTTAGVREWNQTEAGNLGNNQITQLNNGIITTLGVQLVLDDMNQMDAFGMDASMLSTGGAASLISEGLAKRNFSVRKQCEGLVACLFSPVTRKVMFCWSNMFFRGDLNQVNVNYTMFNKRGEPIRATVDIMIQQNAEKYKDEKNGYWDKAYKRAFIESEGSKLGIATKGINNALLNINI